MVCVGQQGLAHSSISTYLSGIRQVQISHGFGDPHLDQMSCLQQVLKGVKVDAGKGGRAPSSWLPIIPAILQKLGQYGYTQNLCSIPPCYGQP